MVGKKELHSADWKADLMVVLMVEQMGQKLAERMVG